MSNARSLSRVFSLASVIPQLVALASNASVLNAIAQNGASPTGAVMMWTADTLPPEGGWIWCTGEVLLPDTEHQALRTHLINGGFKFGQDGEGNPLLPDSRGRSIASPDDMGGSGANRLTASGLGVAATLGAVGGSEAVTLTGSQSGTPEHDHVASSVFSGGATNSAGSHSHSTPAVSAQSDGDTDGLDYGLDRDSRATIPTGSGGAHTHTVTGAVTTTITASTAADAAESHTNVQPTLILPHIIKT